MGKKNTPAKYDKQNSKKVIMNKSKSSVVMIDWDEVAKLSINNIYDMIPENAITIEKISKQFGIERSSAGRRMQILKKSGIYEEYTARQGSHRIKYLIRTSNKPLGKGKTK